MTDENMNWGKNVLVEFEDGIAWVTMNRPEKRNAMNPAMNEEMLSVVKALATDERCRVFVLTGAGESFAAGILSGNGQRSGYNIIECTPHG